MHINPSVKAAELRTPRCQFRFYRDKVRLFHRFDPGAVILETGSKGEIAGILIYTWDEQKFNSFAGPRHWRFYRRILKTLFGLYGWHFGKFIHAFRSMLGKNTKKELEPAQQYGKIWVLMVMAEHRRCGIADKLLQRAIWEMRQRHRRILRVTVSMDNEPAIAAYRKNGFEIVGNCRESCGDSYIMQIKLPP